VTAQLRLITEPDWIDRKWTDADGWPTTAYFAAVAHNLAAREVPVHDWWIEEPWEVAYRIGDHESLGAVPWCVSWRADQDDEPLADGLTGLSWYRTDGNNVWSFELSHTEDPDVVAQEIADWWGAEGRR
jgi:hypothetical protein